MRMPHNYIVIASLLVIILQNCESARYSQLTIVDQIIKKFFNDEEHLWSDINSSTSGQASNATLAKIYAYFDGNLHVLGVGSVEAVRMINEDLATYIDEIRRTQQTETRWLDEKIYDEALQHCENILQTIPSQISQIFEITKSPPFMAYLRENSDFCQTNRRIVSPGVEDLHLQNVVMDFYSTVAEALVKGYMTSQMAYMVQGAKGSGLSIALPFYLHFTKNQLNNSYFVFVFFIVDSEQPLNIIKSPWNCDTHSLHNIEH